MFGAAMMAGVSPARVGFLAQSSKFIRPTDFGAQVGDLLFQIGCDSGGFPTIASSGQISANYSGGDGDAGPDGGGSQWTMVGLRGATGFQSRGGSFVKHPRHAGLVILTEISPNAQRDVVVTVGGAQVGRTASYYSAPTLENTLLSLHLRLQPQYPVYRDGDVIGGNAGGASFNMSI